MGKMAKTVDGYINGTALNSLQSLNTVPLISGSLFEYACCQERLHQVTHLFLPRAEASGMFEVTDCDLKMPDSSRPPRSLEAPKCNLKSSNSSLLRLEHEIRRKAVNIPFDNLDEISGLHPIKLCKVGIEHNLLLTDEQNRFLNLFARDQRLIIYHTRTS